MASRSLFVVCIWTAMSFLRQAVGITRLISPTTQPIYVVLGDRLEMTCSHQSPHKSMIKWHKAEDSLKRIYVEIDRTVSKDIVKKYKVTDEGVQLSTLTKESVIAQDAGSYMCAAGNDLPVYVDVFVIEGITKVISPSAQPVYTVVGGRLELTCSQHGSQGMRRTANIKWHKAQDTPVRKYEEIISGSEPIGFYINSSVLDLGVQLSTLSKTPVATHDAGSYMCSVGTNPPYAVDVYVINVEEQIGLMTAPGNSTTIGCSVVGRGGAVKVRPNKMRWMKNNVVLRGSEEEHFVSIEVSRELAKVETIKYVATFTETDDNTETTLHVNRIGEHDVGIYQCYFELDNGNNFMYNITLNAFPQVKSMGRSKNVLEDDVIDLNCRAWGWPVPNITWSRLDGVLNLTNRVSFPNATTLRIESSILSDRASYVCTAWNTIDGAVRRDNTTILVRVKGRLALLYPLLGIILELLILAVIIFFYERKRTREKEEEEEVEEEQTNLVSGRSNSNAQGHQTNDHVRHRK